MTSQPAAQVDAAQVDTGAFITDAWYVAAWPDEVTRAPLRRILLNRPVLLYRRRDGVAVALADRCSHRFVPLSLGHIEDDDVVCCYHGLRFGPDGRCVHNPHGDGAIPRAAHLPAYPLVERFGALWIWLGEGAADPARIPDFAILGDRARFASVCGVMHVAANYQLITDNLLDLSHAQYLHPGLRVADPVRLRHETRQEGDTVWSCFWRDEGVGNGLMRLLGWPEGRRGNSRAHMRWDPPSLLLLDVGMSPLEGDDAPGIDAPSAHLLTPETATTTHYFWSFMRNTGRDDAALDARIRALGVQAFAGEDKPVIEAQQDNLRGADIMAMNPVLLAPDAAGTRARRIIAARLAAG